jgi:predicted phosphoribosyltransferase
MAYLEKTQISNERDTVINPATEESLILLRRIAKLLESSATSDTANRQRVVIDAGTLTTVTTVAAVTAITNALPAGTNSIGFVGMTGDTRIDHSRTTYENGIRSKLTFS